MPRKPRIEYPGAFYHVMCRGNNGEYIFRNNQDKELYLFLVDKYKERYRFKLYAYCIMDNHVHLLIETGEVPLSKIMQGIQQSYTQRINLKHSRTGHVFQQRYKALLCDGDSYLLQLVKYIHLNPVEAWIDDGLNYKWSSHQDYLKVNKKSVVEVEFILEMLGGDIKRGVKEYRRFMNLDQGKMELSEFVLDEKEVHATVEEFKEMKRVEPDLVVSVDDIINCVYEKTGLSKKELTEKTKLKEYVIARKAIVILSDKYVEISNNEVARLLNLSPSATSKIKAEKRRLDIEVADIVRQVNDELKERMEKLQA
ncbi:transposase [Alkalicella caledoniensis]|uniref:Transposase n=1 Tax=Alkalicella caledoniensis TaxID=2731377 RepID=A0A7G9W6P0_ALKCA|nr:transposase [Alkalicella caledoniensis]QNO14352.1 transposase [Alkalicella caledoniensis]